jgi:hypothetical protein
MECLNARPDPFFLDQPAWIKRVGQVWVEVRCTQTVLLTLKVRANVLVHVQVQS